MYLINVQCVLFHKPLNLGALGALSHRAVPADLYHFEQHMEG